MLHAIIEVCGYPVVLNSLELLRARTNELHRRRADHSHRVTGIDQLSLEDLIAEAAWQKTKDSILGIKTEGFVTLYVENTTKISSKVKANLRER